jgi:uncharacterized protein YjbI with pentapeptide repeats
MFNSCKLLGLHFDDCNGIGLSFKFDHCTLDHSTFYKTNIKKTNFKNCSLKDVDFTECNAQEVVFNNCNLIGATFDNTQLEKADFTSASNYSIHPEHNRIKHAKFNRMNLAGLLDFYQIKIE